MIRRNLGLFDTRIVVLACLLAAGTLLAGCSDMQQSDIAQATDSAEEYLEEQRSVYVRQMKEALDSSEQRLEQFRAKAAELTGDARAEAEQQIKALEQQTAAARDKLDDLEFATAEAWQDMKAGMDAALENLKAAYEQAASKFS